MFRYFSDHPSEVGETYFQHMRTAAGFGCVMAYGMFAAFVHAVFPFLFVKTGSRIICDLNRRMVTHRARPCPGPDPLADCPDTAQVRALCEESAAH